jgi:16S rRNA (guanine527-N7)-methyltransferase
MKPLEQLQQQLHDGLGLEATERQAELLCKHLQFVLERNKTTNITRIEDFTTAPLLHVEDSLQGLTELNEAPEGLLLDMGSGAGYPGIPLAIMSQRQTALLESVQKKAAILQEFIESNCLQAQMQAFPIRIEDFSRENSGRYSCLTARALSSLSSLAELASPLLRKGGQMIAYKGRIEADELDTASAISSKTGMIIANVRNFTLSDKQTTRSIITLTKTSEPTIPLPRATGKAQKSPLKP